MLGATAGRQDKLILVVLFNGFGALPKGEARLERLGLLHQAVHQLSGQNGRVRGDVVDGLFGINLRTLSSRLRQGVNQVAAELEKAGFKHGKQAAWASTDVQDVCLDHDGV